MAYPFPATYQPYYPQYSNQQNMNPIMQPNTLMQGQGNSALIWVQGEAGAKSYMVAPNNTIALWDSESQTVYLKSADASGMPSMKVLEYHIREDAPVIPKTGSKIDYATKEDISIINKEIEQIKANLKHREGEHDESFVSAT